MPDEDILQHRGDELQHDALCPHNVSALRLRGGQIKVRKETKATCTSVILKGFKPRRGNRKSAESAKRTANEISPKQFLIFW
jgi:hypothetical protein